MLRMIARRVFQVAIPNGTDAILWGICLPPGTRVHDIRCKIAVVNQDELNWNKAAFYALEMYLLPVTDPDTPIAYNILWDNLVEKDTDVATLDLDTATADTSSFYEPGEVNWEALMPVGVRPEKLWASHRMITLNDAVMTFQDNQTPFTKKYVSGRRERIQVGRRLKIGDMPMALVMGAASPVTDDTTATSPSTLTEQEWPQVRYMKHVLERALMSALGLTESGATTPWDEATVLLAKQLDPDVLEITAAAFSAVEWKMFGEATIDFSVEGELGNMVVTTGR